MHYMRWSTFFKSVPTDLREPLFVKQRQFSFALGVGLHSFAMNNRTRYFWGGSQTLKAT